MTTSYYQRLSELWDTLEENNTLEAREKKDFWTIVGQLKRQDTILEGDIALASKIRDKLYTQRLGHTFPVSYVIPAFTGCGLLFLVSVFLFSRDSLLEGILLSCVTMTIFMILYYQISLKTFSYGRIVTISIIFLSIGINIILWWLSESFLIQYNKLLVIASIPAFYLNGRWLGGKVSGIKFDGVSQDVFGLYTLKINYQSYLSANPTKRQWIFFFGAIGTITTSLIGAVLIFLWYNDPWYFLVPLLLGSASYLDFLGHGGRLSGSESHHFRRERKIIADYKKSYAS